MVCKTIAVKVVTEEIPFNNFQDERDSWVKAITQLISPSIASKSQQVVTSSQQRGNPHLVSPTHYGEGTDNPKMHANRAYDYLPPQPAAAFTSPTKSKVLPTAVPDSSYYVIEKALFDDPEPQPDIKAVLSNEQKLRSSSQESDPGYDYIKDTVPVESVSAYSTTPTKNGSTAHTTISNPNPRSRSTVEGFREEGYTLMQSVGHLQPVSSKSDPTLPSPESPMDVSKTLKRLSRFNSDQMGHLIDMLRMTISAQSQNGSGPITEQAAIPAVTTPPPRPPKPTQSDPKLPKASGSASLAKSRERPSQLSLSTEVNESVTSSLHANQEHSVYVNSMSLAGEEEDGKSSKKEREREEVSVPTLVVEPTDEESAPPVQRRKSMGLLNTAETANAIKFKLGEAFI